MDIRIRTLPEVLHRGKSSDFYSRQCYTAIRSDLDTQHWLFGLYFTSLDTALEEWMALGIGLQNAELMILQVSWIREWFKPDPDPPFKVVPDSEAILKNKIIGKFLSLISVAASRIIDHLKIL